MVAYICAAEVSTAVLRSWRIFRSPNSKTLFFMIVNMSDFTASSGKLREKSCSILSSYSYSPIYCTACSVSMLLYIESASAVKTKAYSGR